MNHSPSNSLALLSAFGGFVNCKRLKDRPGSPSAPVRPLPFLTKIRVYCLRDHGHRLPLLPIFL